MKILFGPAGNVVPGALASIREVKKMGLDAEEFAFTYSVWMKNDDAMKIKEENKKLGIKLSAHAQYWINLNSDDEGKVEASKKRILKACEKAHYMGAKHVIFHPGYYGKLSAKETYDRIKKAIDVIQRELKKNGWDDVKLTCETTGKVSQFGTVEELRQLREDAGTAICVDFAHLYARSLGTKSYDEIVKQFKGEKNMHCHFSGINYGNKGEMSHKVMEKKDIVALLKALKKYDVSCTIISESPITYEDSLKMKKIWEEIK
ncbi:TIM barrel protein [Candidatus Woesearchaeota archaeon]|nr:TIM barrel protein [Candidatus Woesearchaeota archaeon]